MKILRWIYLERPGTGSAGPWGYVLLLRESRLPQMDGSQPLELWAYEAQSPFERRFPPRDVNNVEFPGALDGYRAAWRQIERAGGYRRAKAPAAWRERLTMLATRLPRDRWPRPSAIDADTFARRLADPAWAGQVYRGGRPRRCLAGPGTAIELLDAQGQAASLDAFELGLESPEFIKAIAGLTARMGGFAFEGEYLERADTNNWFSIVDLSWYRGHDVRALELGQRHALLAQLLDELDEADAKPKNWGLESLRLGRDKVPFLRPDPNRVGQSRLSLRPLIESAASSGTNWAVEAQPSAD